MSLPGHRAAAYVFPRAVAGHWRRGCELCELIASDRRAGPGRELAIHGGRVVLAECDFQANGREFHVLEHAAAGWRYGGAVGPLDTAYSDAIGKPELSAEWMVFGAPRHDAGAVDAGAAFLIHLQPLGID